MDRIHMNKNERRQVVESSESESIKFPGRVYTLERAAKPASVIASPQGHSASNNTLGLLLPPPNHLREITAGVSTNSDDLLQYALGAQNPGSRDVVADLMLRNLMPEWQARLSFLALPRDHQRQSTISLLPVHNTADLSYRPWLTAGNALKVSSVLARTAPHTGEEPPLKKVRPNSDPVADSVFPLSESERKAHFPVPPLIGLARTPVVRALTSLQQTWERLERLSDAMDDTAADQDAFVKELFIRAIYRHKSDHLYKKTEAITHDASDQARGA